MHAELTPDIALAERLFGSLRECSRHGDGVTRDGYGPGEQRAHAIVREAAEAAVLEIEIDHAGNMLMTLPGAQRGARRAWQPPRQHASGRQLRRGLASRRVRLLPGR